MLTGDRFRNRKKLAQTGVKVILGSRDLNKGKDALEKLKLDGIEADLIQYDAFDQNAPQHVFDLIDEKYKKLDILINNAEFFSQEICLLQIAPLSAIKILKIHFKPTFFLLLL